MTKKWFFWMGVTAVALLAFGATIIQATEVYQQATPGQIMGAQAVPAKISYQGMLTESGSPVNGSRDMAFKLFTTSDCSGAALATITKNGVAVQDGLFHVVLDINPAHFNGQELRLQVEVGSDALGCEELLPTPFSLFSASTGALHARPVSATAPATNQVLRWNGSQWTPVADSSHNHFAQSWSGDGASYGIRINNTGSGDGIRANGSTSLGNNWGALYAFNSGSSPGIYANTGGTGTYAAYFGKNIFVTGSCVGCAMVYAAQNGGAAPLEVGDLVAVNGLKDPLLGASMPVMQVTAVNAANAFATVGVVQSRGALEISEKEGEQLESVNMTPGAAETGEYVFVVIQGMAQVKVNASQDVIRAGDFLVVGANGNILPFAADEPSLFEIGRALESPDAETGLVWVLIGAR